MIFTHPRCLQCFPTQENSNQRPSTLKLPPLIFQVFLSWSALSLSPLQNLQRNTYIVPCNCQNRVTFCQIVTRLVRTIQGTTNLILKTWLASRNRVTIGHPAKHALGIAKSWHAPQIVSRFQVFPNHKLKA